MIKRFIVRALITFVLGAIFMSLGKDYQVTGIIIWIIGGIWTFAGLAG